MGGHIRAMVDNIFNVVSDIRKCYCETPLRVAFVGYRDHCDGANRLAVEPFTMDVEVFKAKVKSQVATGGGDEPEDIHGALNVADTNLEWKSATRILFHIADAPCHGNEFNDCGGGDSYKDGDPLGLKMDNILKGLAMKNILYFFGGINRSTDKMISVFNAKMGKPFVTVVSCQDASTMMGTVSKTISETYSASVSSSASSTEKIDTSHIILSTAEPKWSELNLEAINKFRMKQFTKVADLLALLDDSACVEPIPEVTRVKVGKLPFAKGSLRAAYKVQEGARSFIHKLSMHTKASHLTRESYVSSSVSTHCAAVCVAQEFNRVKPAGTPSIEFLIVDLVQYLERPGTPFCTQEQVLPVDEWHKYNNNSGMVLRKEGVEHGIVQTFSHWSYTHSGGELMIVDCQGVYHSPTNTFKLTDPAVHCKDVLRFGGTNLGKDGFIRFFKSHECNAHCRKLGLTKPKFE